MSNDAAARLKLTRTMYEAIAYARVHSNRLVRYPGGFWVGFGCAPYTSRTFGGPTVNALVTRNAATFTRWQEGRSGKFPIEATLTDTYSSPGAAAVQDNATTEVKHGETRCE